MRSFRKPLIPLNGAKVRRKSHLAKLFPCFLPCLAAFLGPYVVARHFRASEPLGGPLFQQTREGGKLGIFRGVTYLSPWWLLASRLDPNLFPKSQSVGPVVRSLWAFLFPVCGLSCSHSVGPLVRSLCGLRFGCLPRPVIT